MGQSKFTTVKEADLSHHLENGNNKSKTEKDDEAGENSLDIKDYPLHEAVTLLKGLSFVK